MICRDLKTKRYIMYNSTYKSKLLSNYSAIPAQLKAKLKSFGQADDGMAAVEFAFLSPILIALYFGLVEIATIINADKLTSHATNVAGDLATQVTNMDLDDIEDVFEAALATMSLDPAKSANVTMEVISYNMPSAGVRQELGRATLNGGLTGQAYDPANIGTRLLTTDSGAIVARVQYSYESVTYKFVEQFTTLEETFILKPRSSQDIPFALDGTIRNYTCNSTGSYTVNCT